MGNLRIDPIEHLGERLMSGFAEDSARILSIIKSAYSRYTPRFTVKRVHHAPSYGLRFVDRE